VPGGENFVFSSYGWLMEKNGEVTYEFLTLRHEEIFTNGLLQSHKGIQGYNIEN